MESLPRDALLHIINMLVRRSERQRIVDYRIFAMSPPSLHDGRMQQASTPVSLGEESMASLLQRGYSILKVEYRVPPSHHVGQHWAHVVKYASS